MTMPTVGRIVHYTSYGTPGGEFGQECRAAVVTVDGWFEVNEMHTSLAILNPTGMFFNTAIPQDESKSRGGTWHWPCVRVSHDEPV
jgi:hypothetical protein